MTREQAYILLNDIIRDVLEDETVTVDDTTDPWRVPGWDAVAEIGVLAAVEIHFGIRLRADEAEPIATVSDLIDLILDKAPRLSAG